MQLHLGSTIRQLRREAGRTQEDLAGALGITSQAVSRWEAGGSYPDMELIPAIANYFGVTIDELFGYTGDRERKIDAIIGRVEEMGIPGRSDDEWVDGCLALLREGLAEFPGNERLLITLADALSEAGWRRHHEWLYYDEEGLLRHDFDRHRKNEYWTEAVKICEELADRAEASAVRTKAVTILVLLYRNIGETAKAVACAERMPELKNCRERLRAFAADGREMAAFAGDFLLKAAKEFAEQTVYALMADRRHFDSELPIEKVKGAMDLFRLICDDGNFGPCHGDMISLCLYLSRLQWERGYRDDAFRSLDQALEHARKLEELMDGEEHRFTAPLVSAVTYRTEPGKKIAAYLPDDWPFWSMPDCSETAREIQADPRWAEWVSRAKA